MKKKKKSKKQIKKASLIPLHVYGIFDKGKKTMVRISLDHSDIQMEIALMGGLKSNLIECEFNIGLAL